ncbi:MAG TPA: alkaline phosphatase family protein [Acidimicrobiales bacterium]|nr:alkaline phosphatase family protein [Acidimicrobiales bacterium]
MTDRHIDRRDFLTGTLGAAAAFAAGAAGSKLIRSAGPAPLRPAAERPMLAAADFSAIKHVVFLMHENRSFDHYFGVLHGVNGFFDGSSALESSAAFYQDWPGNGSPLQPFHLDTTSGIGECTNDLSHSWQAEHASWNGGGMDAFVSTHTLGAFEGPEQGVLTMGYYTPNDIPFYYALAQSYTICDNYFCSVLGPTHPNRLMQMTGTVDPDGTAGGPILITAGATQADLIGSCAWTTMPEVLQGAGVSWKVYNPAGSAYQPTGGPIAMALCKNPLFYMRQHTGASPSSPMFQNAFSYTGIGIPTNAKVFGGLSTTGAASDFVADVKANTLPQVSWIIPPDGYDEHPPAPAALGEWYTAQVIKTLQSNKEVWESTVLFIMYDENDGWFDHVQPPSAPPGTPGEYVTASQSTPVNGATPLDTSYAVGAPGYTTPYSSTSFVDQPIGLGVRVPMLVVSPFSQGGWVCSDVFDHTSQLQFLGSVFGVDATVGGNVSAWRRAGGGGGVGDLTSTLTNFPLPTIRGKPVFPKNPKLPKTSDKDNAAPIAAPNQCTPNDLLELGAVSSPGGPSVITPFAVNGCSTVSGSVSVTAPKGTDFIASGVKIGQIALGAGIPGGATVLAVAKAKGKTPAAVTLSTAATTSSTGDVAVTFIQPVPVYPIPPSQPLPTEIASTLKPAPG